MRSPLDVVMRAFAISRNQRFELELRNVPETVEVVVLPAPPDERELFDFSGGARSSSTRPTSSPARPSTTPRPRADGASSAAPGGAATSVGAAPDARAVV